MEGYGRTAPYPVLSLIWKSMSDVDDDARQGIAIYGASQLRGTWQYELTRGVWQTVGDVSDESALLLPASAHIRFVPLRDFAGTVRLYYRGPSLELTFTTNSDSVSLVDVFSIPATRPLPGS
jgi:hypothetical protein